MVVEAKEETDKVKGDKEEGRGMQVNVCSELWQDDLLRKISLDDDDDDGSDKADEDFFVDEFEANLDQGNITLKIENRHQSTREMVGLQVWRAGLYLADYMLDSRHCFEGKTVLELAAGTGLLSIVSASNLVKAKKVICTDIDKGDILPQIKRNFELNVDALAPDTEVVVTELDFFKPVPHAIVRNVDTIVVGDVIYDPQITAAFFKCLENLLVDSDVKTCTVYVAMEARSRGNEVRDTLVIMKQGLKDFQSSLDSRKRNLSLEKIEKGSFSPKFLHDSSEADMHMWKMELVSP